MLHQRNHALGIAHEVLDSKDRAELSFLDDVVEHIEGVKLQAIIPRQAGGILADLSGEGAQTVRVETFLCASIRESLTKDQYSAGPLAACWRARTAIYFHCQRHPYGFETI